MCGGICGPVGDINYSECRYNNTKCNTCGKLLRQCSCLEIPKKSTNKKKKRSVIEELAEGC